jgi:hypothetical protein
MLALDIVLPLIVVQGSLRFGLSAVVALSIAALFPLADTVIGFVAARTVSIIGAVSLVAILTGIGLAFSTGDARFAILKDSAFSFLFSLLFLASLASSRPLIFRLNAQMIDPAGAAAFERAWTERAAVRDTFRFMTLVWGLGLLLEALVRVLASFTLPVRTAAAASPWIAFVCIGGLIAWTIGYAKARRQAAERAGVRLP